ncbi:MAG TPA: F0F1 ATP synthase subunit A [Caldilineaceae bacterium]|nr:F0F1 ATP synthase subunit A [Caldilineaceae bacterium]
MESQPAVEPAPGAEAAASVERRPVVVSATPAAPAEPTEPYPASPTSTPAVPLTGPGQPKPNIFQRTWDRSQAWVQANPRRAAIWAGAILLLIIGFFIPVEEPHVALSGEPIFSQGPWWLTNSILTTLLIDLIILLLALSATLRMQMIPSGMQNFMEMVIEYLYGLAESIAGRDAQRFFPWVATIFFLVIISNWSGLIPGVGSIGYFQSEVHLEEPHQEEEEQQGEQALSMDRQLAMADGNLMVVLPAPAPQEGEGQGQEPLPGETEAAAHEAHFVPLFRSPSADLNLTFALALTVMVMVQVWGIRALGGSYFRKFFNASGQGFMKGINIFVGLLELISEFSRLIAFGFRLFGNIFAGEVVLATMAFLIPFLLPVPFYILEVFVGLVQALVFMMLALVFFSMATISHGHNDHGEHHGHGEGQQVVHEGAPI